MKWIIVALAAAAIGACSAGLPSGQQIAEAQAKSKVGPTSEWKVDPSVSRAELQDMRDRAYGYCYQEKASDEKCLVEQDLSLFEYARSFALIRIFHSERYPTFPYARGHQADPAAFERIRTYCRSIYEDHGRADARLLGPCMLDGLGGDFFGVASVD
jgi:hypothetical protein